MMDQMDRDTGEVKLQTREIVTDSWTIGFLSVWGRNDSSVRPVLKVPVSFFFSPCLNLLFGSSQRAQAVNATFA